MTTGFMAPPKIKTVEDLPINGRVAMVVKVSLVASLVWSYVDAVLYTAAQMRRQDTKVASREIHALKREYDQFLKFDKTTVDKAQELGELFEVMNRNAFRQLSEELRVEIRHKALLDADNEYLILVTQMAMTLIDALRLYDDDCMEWMESEGVPNHTVIPSHITRLAKILPQFAMECYDPQSSIRRVVARILHKQIKEIEPYDEHGRI